MDCFRRDLVEALRDPMGPMDGVHLALMKMDCFLVALVVVEACSSMKGMVQTGAEYLLVETLALEERSLALA